MSYFKVTIIGLSTVFIMKLHAVCQKLIFAVLDVRFGFLHNVLNC